ncbi:vgr related protein [Sphingomonas quercus]|uniref:Vgr related protein n=1 Tax=Sphingomonas quercus TaxID=2842451 RepID=A0ABS6BE00_9SPHN|nr:vgr related protein [Sphingomonas quercus]MBU3076547.1 vgr related protein [Sphingomonas quercus]
MFGDAIDTAAVRLHRRRWWPFQPRHYCMAPDGHLWFHPEGDLWQEDFADAPLALQGLFIHEMTHVWQTARGGRWWLPLMRHPFCRYRYALTPGKPFAAYGIEQQAEIVRHAFLLRNGWILEGRPQLSVYETLLPFPA